MVFGAQRSVRAAIRERNRPRAFGRLSKGHRARKRASVFTGRALARSFRSTCPLHPPIIAQCLAARIISIGRCPPQKPGVDCVLGSRSEEHTSELQSQSNLVCRLLLEKKKEK